MIHCDAFVAMVRMLLFCSNVMIKRITSAADVQMFTHFVQTVHPRNLGTSVN